MSLLTHSRCGKVLDRRASKTTSSDHKHRCVSELELACKGIQVNRSDSSERRRAGRWSTEKSSVRLTWESDP